MEDTLKEVIEKAIGESVQRSIEPFMRAVLRSIKLVKDEADAISAELETHSKETSSNLEDSLNLLQSIYERIQKFEALQSEMELKSSMIAQSNRSLDEIIENKVRDIVMPLERTMQKVLDQQLTLSKIVERIMESLENIEREVAEFKSSTLRVTMSSSLTERAEEVKTEEGIAESVNNVLFSRLEEAVKSLSEESKELEEKTLEGVEKTAQEETTEEAEKEPEQISEQVSSNIPASIEEVTIEVDKLQERLAEIDREITDLTFDRMRGILSEEEYQEKKEELIKEKEKLKKKIEELTLRMT